MHIKKVSIENVRGFLDGDSATTLELSGNPGWHVFAGRNGAGKSTLLRAIALALVGPDHSRRLMPSFSGWLREKTQKATVSVDLVAQKGDEFRGVGKQPKDSFNATMSWNAVSGGSEPELTVSPERAPKLKGPWRGPWSENPSGWMLAGYGPFRRLTGHGVDAQRSMTGAAHEARLVTLFREDASLLEASTWLRDLQFRSLEKRPGAKDRLDSILELLNDDLLPDNAQVARVDSDGLWVKRAGSTIEMRDLSDGYRVAIAFVLDILRHLDAAHGKLSIVSREGRKVVQNFGMVLIDEADAHLHVAWQQRLGFWLVERFPSIQFLVTTHSPFICQAAAQGGLFSLPAPGERRGVRRVDEDTYRRVVNGTADQAVLSSLFGLERARSLRATRLVSEYSDLRARLARAKLTLPEQRRMRELEAQLPLPYSTGS